MIVIKSNWETFDTAKTHKNKTKQKTHKEDFLLEKCSMKYSDKIEEVCVVCLCLSLRFECLG